MISYIDGNVYVQIPPDAVDALAVAVLKEGKNLAEYSLHTSIKRIVENGGKTDPHHMADLQDNLTYLDAFNTLLEYYGAD